MAIRFYRPGSGTTRTPATRAAALAAMVIAGNGVARAAAQCPWDCTPVDGQVDVRDLLRLLADWGGSSPCDADGNGAGLTDLLGLLGAWGPCAATGACCDLTSGACVVGGQTNCEDGGGLYKGDGTDCTPNPCVGACCDADGTCSLLAEVLCVFGGGGYLGDGTTCAPTGACCVADGECIQTTAACCAVGGGDFVGEGVSCTNPNPCQCPTNVPNCLVDCPTGATVIHATTITGTGLGTEYGEGFNYFFVPAGKYCLDLREVVTTAPGDDGCNCDLSTEEPLIEYRNLLCAADDLGTGDIVSNIVNNPGTPCPCVSKSTQELQCRPKKSTDPDAWVTFHTNELKWERKANGDIVVTVTPMGGAAVSHSQAGPACPP